MRVPPRLVAVLGFLVVGLLALIVAGLLDWIVGVLFLLMEFLGELLRNVFRRRKARRHPSTRSRPVLLSAIREFEPRRRAVRRRHPQRRPRAGLADLVVAETATATEPPRTRLMLPVSGDDPDLVAFALEECRLRQAELLVLFLRPIAIIPMGPNALPGLSEDEEAMTLFERVGSEAERVGVPMRFFYASTRDRSGTIGEAASQFGAGIIVVGSARPGRLLRYLTADPTPALIRLLPERTSLLIHAS